MEDTGTADTQDVDDVNSVGDGSGGDDSNSDGAQVSTTIKLYDIVYVSANCLQNNGAEFTGADNDPPQTEDDKCVAVPTCLANSGDHRKVVSHIFGRNKSCTRDLPDDLWIYWCRKHYQRLKYRAEDSESWHTRQLGLVRTQLQTFEDWGQVRSWNIELRKAEKDAIIKEDKKGVRYTNYISSCWERFLVPYLGVSKTYAQVRQVLDLIERKFNEREYHDREKKLKTFPGVEFLPNVAKAKAVKKPAPKKGEVGYKKITLDQPAFKRKTRANSEIIKVMEATKRKTPTIDDAATDGTITEDTINKTPSSTPLSTKRRRLTRGFEKHGSDTDESPSKEKKDEV